VHRPLRFVMSCAGVWRDGVLGGRSVHRPLRFVRSPWMRKKEWPVEEWAAKGMAPQGGPLEGMASHVISPPLDAFEWL
jgi:hypothetical protein